MRRLLTGRALGRTPRLARGERRGASLRLGGGGPDGHSASGLVVVAQGVWPPAEHKRVAAWPLPAA